jgi:hypothetical protein
MKASSGTHPHSHRVLSERPATTTPWAKSDRTDRRASRPTTNSLNEESRLRSQHDHQGYEINIRPQRGQLIAGILISITETDPASNPFSTCPLYLRASSISRYFSIQVIPIITKHHKALPPCLQQGRFCRRRSEVRAGSGHLGYLHGRCRQQVAIGVDCRCHVIYCARILSGACLAGSRQRARRSEGSTIL